MSVKDITTREYLIEQIQLVKQLIDKEGYILGKICPICGVGTFVRVLDHVVYDLSTKVVSGLGVYFVICSECGFKMKDVWETKEEWELGIHSV